MRYVIRERLRVTRQGHRLETVGYYVQDTKQAKIVSPVYRTREQAQAEVSYLEGASK